MHFVLIPFQGGAGTPGIPGPKGGKGEPSYATAVPGTPGGLCLNEEGWSVFTQTLSLLVATVMPEVKVIL